MNTASLISCSTRSSSSLPSSSISFLFDLLQLPDVESYKPRRQVWPAFLPPEVPGQNFVWRAPLSPLITSHHFWFGHLYNGSLITNSSLWSPVGDLFNLMLADLSTSLFFTSTPRLPAISVYTLEINTPQRVVTPLLLSSTGSDRVSSPR